MNDARQIRTPHAPTLLRIDLDAIVANYRLLAKLSAPAECAAVVKADAYGLGVAPVAQAFQNAGCRTFFVATLDEGIELRRLLDDDIYVFNGVMTDEIAEFAEHSLRPVLNDLDQIAAWRAFGAQDSPQPAAISVDTGMNRLGLSTLALNHIRTNPTLLDGVDARLVLSHLACADESLNQKNTDQLQFFRESLLLFPRIAASLSASAGIFLGSEWRFDLVRPGIALYGGNPRPSQPNPMNQVIRLSARILQCRDVGAGETIGYSATRHFRTTRQIATVGIGYADGFFRSLSDNGMVYIGQKSCPVVGRVSMDLISVDITGIDGVKAGDWVDLIGQDHNVDALAAEAGTIGYEILTALSSRHQRVYVGANV